MINVCLHVVLIALWVDRKYSKDAIWFTGVPPPKIKHVIHGCTGTENWAYNMLFSLIHIERYQLALKITANSSHCYGLLRVVVIQQEVLMFGTHEYPTDKVKIICCLFIYCMPNRNNIFSLWSMYACMSCWLPYGWIGSTVKMQFDLLVYHPQK